MRRAVSNGVVINKRALFVTFVILITLVATIILCWPFDASSQPDSLVTNGDVDDEQFYFDFEIDAQIFNYLSNQSMRINPTDGCECRQNTYISLEKQNKDSKIYSVYLVNEKQNKSTFLYNVTSHELNRSLNAPCNLYSMLLRGKNQKVVSYSLFGTDRFYTDKLKNISEQIAQMYPGWLMRIYHDRSANKSLMCELECNSNNEFAPIDLCDITILSVNFNDGVHMNVSFIHPGVWRYLALGDEFVDVVSFRDSDSFIFQREVDSVDVWLKAQDKIAHIMRDNPRHRDPIMGGMWGFKPKDDRALAKRIFQLVIDPNLASYYFNPDSNIKDYKTGDQDFLANHVYSLIARRAVIHDSYACMFHRYSSAWPTQRQGNCYVGSSWFCNATLSNYYECPVECRPKENPDWIYC